MKTAGQEKAKRQQLKDWAVTMNTSTDPVERRKASSGIYKVLFPALIHHFSKKMVGGSKATIEDLAIETLERAFDKVALYNDVNTFSTWVFRIADNLFIDHLRKSTRASVISVDGLNYNPTTGDYGGSDEFSIFEIASGGFTPEEATTRDQYHHLLHEAVNNGLSDKERTAISLYYFEQRTYDEIMDEMSIPIGTVKALLFRAKERLNKRFAPR